MSVDPYLRLPGVGRCDLVSRIGEGGTGVVYRGRHCDLDLDVAVKFLHAHLADKPGISDRFLREARLAARLNSPAIVRVFDCGEADGHYYIVMEFVDGQTLAAHDALRKALPSGSQPNGTIGGDQAFGLESLDHLADGWAADL